MSCQFKVGDIVKNKYNNYTTYKIRKINKKTYINDKFKAITYYTYSIIDGYGDKYDISDEKYIILVESRERKNEFQKINSKAIQPPRSNNYFCCCF